MDFQFIPTTYATHKPSNPALLQKKKIPSCPSTIPLDTWERLFAQLLVISSWFASFSLCDQVSACMQKPIPLRAQLWLSHHWEYLKRSRLRRRVGGGRWEDKEKWKPWNGEIRTIHTSRVVFLCDGLNFWFLIDDRKYQPFYLYLTQHKWPFSLSDLQNMTPLTSPWAGIVPLDLVSEKQDILKFAWHKCDSRVCWVWWLGGICWLKPSVGVGLEGWPSAST